MASEKQKIELLKLKRSWYVLKAYLFSNDQKRNRGAQKMNLFTILVEQSY